MGDVLRVEFFFGGEIFIGVGEFFFFFFFGDMKSFFFFMMDAFE